MKYAISAHNVSKRFDIPHEKKTTLKEHFVHAFDRTRYESFNAVQDVSFSIKNGEFVGIIGANGSGKSTLLKIIAGIYTPTSGKIVVDGRISPFLELGVGFDPELSGKENVYLNASVLGLTKKQIDERYNDIVAFAELERFMDMKVKNYSSGMFVRLAFSVAIQVDADILLMDEVLAVGDAHFQEKCFNVFRKFKEEGKTIVLVTHDSGSIRRFCDRCIYLKKGALKGDGSPEEVIDSYIYEQGENNQIESSEVVAPDSEEETKGRGDGIPETDKRVYFTKYELIDKNNKSSTSFCSGDDLKVKVNFKCKDKNIKKVNAGIAIYDEYGNHIFGDRSEWSEVLMDCKKGEFELVLKELPLLSGSYFITLALDSIGDTEHYDWLDKKLYFDVKNNKSQVGRINFLTKWKA